MHSVDLLARRVDAEVIRGATVEPGACPGIRLQAGIDDLRRRSRQPPPWKARAHREWAPPVRRLVEKAPEPPDIGGGRQRPAFDLLRRHVPASAHSGEPATDAI